MAISCPAGGGRSVYAVIDLVDIMTHIALRSNKLFSEKGSAISKEDFVNAVQLRTTQVREIWSFAGENKSLHVYKPTETIATLLEHMSKGIHRAIVRGEPLKVLSQYDVIKYIYFNRHLLPEKMLKDTAKNLGLVSRSHTVVHHTAVAIQDVVTVNTSDTALDAFRLLVKEGVAAAPVLDGNGAIVSTISASDLRGLTVDCIEYNIFLPISEFFKKVASESTRTHQIIAPLVFSESVTLASLLEIIVTAHVHRVWIVDAGGKPRGCVSLTDLCQFFATKKI